VSVNDLTIRAAFVAGLALFALLLTGWRKTARATPKTSRGVDGTLRRVPYAVVREPTPPYHAPNPLRRLWALVASGGLTVIIGAVIATVVAFGVSVIVTRMTDLLKQ
jgi:hypothetical protein